MAFDACMMRAVLSEFSKEFPEAKIEKVLQPQNDEIDLVIHYGKVTKRLVFNVGPNAPRLQLSDIAKENPKAPPMFCMFLRKRLSSAKIISARQINFDRIAEFTLLAYDEMGFQTTLKIICEIMGKYANFILLNSENKIISALKMIDFSSSSVRQILPGLTYTPPEIQAKLSPLSVEAGSFFEKYSLYSEDKKTEKFITDTYSGVATQIARELCYRAYGRLDVPLSEGNANRLYSVLCEWSALLRSEQYTPTVATLGGKPQDYSYMKISYLEASARIDSFPSFSSLFDLYFAERDRIEKINHRARDIKNLLSSATSRTERKLSIQRQALADSERAEEYKIKGDLITANLYKIKRGDKKVDAVNYYAQDCPTVTIELDSRLSGSENAQKLYKQYAKAKNAKAVLTDQIAKWESELRYLESVSAFLDRAECEQDIIDIRDELFRAGYASRMRGYKPPRLSASKPRVLKTSGGFTVLVGRNNTQNDTLTFKLADKADIWFHVKDIPGSHVILVTEGREPSEIDYTEAASIAAGYSTASADLVAVDYTRVKNVKKPSGSRPGFVIYKTNYTAFVKPRKEIAE